MRYVGSGQPWMLPGRPRCAKRCCDYVDGEITSNHLLKKVCFDGPGGVLFISELEFHPNPVLAP